MHKNKNVMISTKNSFRILNFLYNHTFATHFFCCCTFFLDQQQRRLNALIQTKKAVKKFRFRPLIFRKNSFRFLWPLLLQPETTFTNELICNVCNDFDSSKWKKNNNDIIIKHWIYSMICIIMENKWVRFLHPTTTKKKKKSFLLQRVKNSTEKSEGNSNFHKKKQHIQNVCYTNNWCFSCVCVENFLKILEFYSFFSSIIVDRVERENMTLTANISIATQSTKKKTMKKNEKSNNMAPILCK